MQQEHATPIKRRDSGRYAPGSHLRSAADFGHFRVERWTLAAGQLDAVTFAADEVAVVTSGRAVASRTANGRAQTACVQRGSAFVCPRGVQESSSRLLAAIETIHIRLFDEPDDAPSLELAYAGWLADALLYQIVSAIGGAIGDEDDASRLFVDGMHCALIAHLRSNYSVDRWLPPSGPDLGAKRLARVLDCIEARIAEPLTLRELAREACLSEFHFSRLFRSSTGLSPHRYVTSRRLQVAQAALERGRGSLLEIALDSGFGTQANFIRTFRKFVGLTPGRYRALHRRRTPALESTA